MKINDNNIYETNFKVKLADIIEARHEADGIRVKSGIASLDYCIDHSIDFSDINGAIQFFTEAVTDVFYYTAAAYIVNIGYWNMACERMSKSYRYHYNKLQYLIKLSSSGKKPAHAIMHMWISATQYSLMMSSKYLYCLPHDMDKFTHQLDIPVTNFKGYNKHKQIAEHHFDKDANSTFGSSLSPGMYFKIYEEHIDDIIQTCLQKGMPSKGSHFHRQTSDFYLNIEHDKCNYYYLLSQGFTDLDLLGMTYQSLAMERPDLLLLPVNFGVIIHYPDIEGDYAKDFGVPFYCEISNGELKIDSELRSICRTSTNHMSYIMRSIHEIIKSDDKRQESLIYDKMFKHFEREKLIDAEHDNHLLHMELDALLSCSDLTEEEYFCIDHIDRLLLK